MKNKEIVQKEMSRMPVEVQATDSIDDARLLMREHGVRHLPVFRGSKICGIVSDRDIKFYGYINKNNIDDESIETIMSTDIVSFSPVTPIYEVADKMLQDKVGSALIIDGDTLVGIFTVNDALRILAQT